MTTTELAAEIEYEIASVQALQADRDCERFASLLGSDLEALAQIETAEQRWLQHLRTGGGSFDPEFDERILQHYRQWHRHATKVRARQLRLQIAKGCVPPNAEEFRRRVEEIADKIILRSRAAMAMRARSQMARADS